MSNFLFFLSCKIFFLSYIFWTCCIASSSASPWARPSGELLTISQTNYFANRQVFQDGTGDNVTQRFQRIETDIYLEYGLSSSVTIGAKAAYGNAWLTRGDDVETAAGFSEFGGFAQYQLLRKDNSAGAIRLGVSAPSNFNDGVREGLQSDGVDADISILYGRNLSNAPFKVFASIHTGYRKRFGDAADQIRIQTALGAEPNQRWLILMQSFTELSMRNEAPNGADYDVAKLQLSVVRYLGAPETGRWSIQAGINEEITGRNLALGRSLFFSLWRRF